ncbi:MAG TPA: zinc ribbon domain-containing protein [Candidatus Dormibacteraeota bacterium]
MSTTYCINCGETLADDHRYCPRCGAERWTPPPAPPPPSGQRPPPGAGSQSFQPAPVEAPASPRLRWLPFVFAAGAVFWLVELTQFAAVLAAPAGRDQLQQALVAAGIKQDLSTVLVVESILVFVFEVSAAAVHAVAYFGLRKLRPWGWVAAVIVAAAWSLVLVGIPVLVVLLRRTTRQTYGVS